MRSVHPLVTFHDSPSKRARIVDRGARMTVKPLLKIAPADPRMFRRVQVWSGRIARPASVDITSEVTTVGGVPGEKMTPAAGTTSNLTLLYLHGGGFFVGSVDSYRGLLEAFVRATGGTVYAIDYRQLPDHPIAESVADSISAYIDVLDRATDRSKVVVAGDSAGGYLTMKVAELATRRGLTAPAALIGFSPLLSLTPERTDKSVERIDKVREALLPPKRIDQIRSMWLPPGSVIEGFADPLHATAYISSPTHLVAVEGEFLRPEIEAFAGLLDRRGVEVDVHIWRGQIHAFPMMADVLSDAARAVQLAADFALRQIGEPRTMPQPPAPAPRTQTGE